MDSYACIKLPPGPGGRVGEKKRGGGGQGVLPSFGLPVDTS